MLLNCFVVGFEWNCDCNSTVLVLRFTFHNIDNKYYSHDIRTDYNTLSGSADKPIRKSERLGKKNIRRCRHKNWFDHLNLSLSWFHIEWNLTARNVFFLNVIFNTNLQINRLKMTGLPLLLDLIWFDSILFCSVLFCSGFIAERVNLRYFLSLGMLISGILTYLFGLAYSQNIHSAVYFFIIMVRWFLSSKLRPPSHSF